MGEASEHVLGTLARRRGLLAVGVDVRDVAADLARRRQLDVPRREHEPLYRCDDRPWRPERPVRMAEAAFEGVRLQLGSAGTWPGFGPRTFCLVRASFCLSFAPCAWP